MPNISHSSPLISTIISFYVIILLYFPFVFLKLVLFSPVFISTVILLLFLLRLGSSQQLKAYDHLNPVKTQVLNELQRPKPESSTRSGQSTQPEPVKFDKRRVEIDDNPIEVEEKESDPDSNGVEIRPKPDIENHEMDPHGPESDRLNRELSVRWEVGAPLEVIYEAYEGEEEEEGQNDAFDQGKLQRYPSLSRYYPETDSESDSESGSGSDSSDSLWGGDEKEGLIEIALDFHGYNKLGMKNKMEIDCVEEEEDNLIEIDIFPTTTHHGFSW